MNTGLNCNKINTTKNKTFQMPRINSKKIVDTFVTSAEIWAPSGHEKPMADKMIHDFQSINIKGMTVEVDDTGPKTGSDTGNVIIDIPPSEDAPPDAKNICLSFHLDRVPVHAPGVPADEPVQIEITPDGIIKSKGERTNIAADDLCGYTAIKEAVELTNDNHIPHGRIRVIGFAKEEPGIFGAREIDQKYLSGLDYGFEMDGGSVGNIIKSGAGIVHFNARILGQSSPSIHPSGGKNAMTAGVDAVSKLSGMEKGPGQILNISNFESGTRWETGEAVTNVVPDRAYIAGEIRARTGEEEKTLCEKLENTMKESADKYNVSCSIDYDKMEGFNLAEDTPVVNFASRATGMAGVKPKIINTMGGSDANYMNQKGLPTVVIGSGAHLQHTEREYTTKNDLVRATQVIMSIIAATAMSPVASAVTGSMKEALI